MRPLSLWDRLPPPPWMDPLLCVSDLEATICHHPRSAASEHRPRVLEPDLAPQQSPLQASWRLGLVADERELMLSVRATGVALDAEPQHLSIGADAAANDGQPV
jgi:hypothetical protein